MSPGDAYDRLQLRRDVTPILLVQPLTLPNTEWREPPGDIVVSGNHDHRRRGAPGRKRPRDVPEKHRRPLKLARPRPLREITGDGDDVEVLVLGHRVDRIGLLRHRRPPEMHVGQVENPHHVPGLARSSAMTASVNSPVLAAPPRSRVTHTPLRIVVSNAARMRFAL